MKKMSRWAIETYAGDALAGNSAETQLWLFRTREKARQFIRAQNLAGKAVKIIITQEERRRS